MSKIADFGIEKIKDLLGNNVRNSPICLFQSLNFENICLAGWK